LANLLAGFRARLHKRHLDASAAEDRISAIQRVLVGYRQRRTRWAETQRASADEFNLFEVMQVEHDEVRHSMILASLLDCRIEHGTHAQGSLGLRLFLEELQEELDPSRALYIEDYPRERYWVRREVSSSESRVDIEIAASNKFVIHIENKILSDEGDDQTHREWRDLNRRAELLGIAPAHRHAIFLTLDGLAAGNANFHPVSWDRIGRVLDRFAEQALPPYVRLFARHYSDAVRKLAASAQSGMERLYGEETV
jgi:hypothetical protein